MRLTHILICLSSRRPLEYTFYNSNASVPLLLVPLLLCSVFSKRLYLNLISCFHWSPWYQRAKVTTEILAEAKL